MNKVIEKNLFYLSIHIVPKDAVNDACDIDYRSHLQIDLMRHMSLSTTQIIYMYQNLSDSTLNLGLSLTTQDKNDFQKISLSSLLFSNIKILLKVIISFFSY